MYTRTLLEGGVVLGVGWSSLCEQCCHNRNVYTRTLLEGGVVLGVGRSSLCEHSVVMTEICILEHC